MKYKQYASEMKEEIVLEYSKGGISIARLAEKYSLNRNTLASWIKKTKKGPDPSQPPTVIDITSAIMFLAAASVPSDPEMVSFRLNDSFEIEMRRENLKAFLEAMRDAGMWEEGVLLFRLYGHETWNLWTDKEDRPAGGRRMLCLLRKEQENSQDTRIPWALCMAAYEEGAQRKNELACQRRCLGSRHERPQASDRQHRHHQQGRTKGQQNPTYFLAWFSRWNRAFSMTFLFTFYIENGKKVVAKIMKDNKIIDYSSLTKEELISLIMKSKKGTESISQKLDSVTKEIKIFTKRIRKRKSW